MLYTYLIISLEYNKYRVCLQFCPSWNTIIISQMHVHDNLLKCSSWSYSCSQIYFHLLIYSAKINMTSIRLDRIQWDCEYVFCTVSMQYCSANIAWNITWKTVWRVRRFSLHFFVTFFFLLLYDYIDDGFFLYYI